jgi:signal transduction histidine kinase
LIALSKDTILPLDWKLPKRLFRFPPTFAQNLVVLIVSLAGIVALVVYESYQEGLTARHGVAIALLAALSAATAMLIYQERHSWVLLRDLRSALAKIAPSYARLTADNPSLGGTEGLEKEIRTLTERWTEFCLHCQRVHDAEMVHAEHLATLGEIAAGVAHEIRNPLAGIAGAIEIITKDFPKDHPDREVLEDLRQEVRRIEKTLNELLVYARPKPPQFGQTDVKETIARTLQLARQQTGSRKVEFSIQVSPALPQFLADGEQLHQVLLNLVLNSIQAIDREGRIAIEARRYDDDGPYASGMVEIAVSDTGPGIPPEHLDRIFRPFYTTKRGGTGLGLSLCRRIIAAHGGTLSAESEPNKGSRFVIRIPLREVAEEVKQVYAQ